MADIREIWKEFGLEPAQLESAQSFAAQHRVTLFEAFEKLELLDAAARTEGFCKIFEVEPAPSFANTSKKTLRLIPKDFAKKYQVFPVAEKAGTVTVATADPKNREVVKALKFRLKTDILFVLAAPSVLAKAIEKNYVNVVDMSALSKGSSASKSSSKKERIQIGKVKESDGPIVKIVNFILHQCVEKGASDIHIEPYETTMRCRLRIDGSLVEVTKIPLNLKDGLISRIKIMSKLDIAERRKPQDGAISVQMDKDPIDFRVSILPTMYGEKVVMRILDQSNLELDMTKLGFMDADLKRFKTSIHRPFGIVLVTGPTGSGKTTTLYSALAELNNETENIMTAEDPVEFQIEGINQVQMKPDVGLDFSAALKSFLRQDPDIILVGEIRDLTTGEIATKAALTGHLVMSTLHTNSASDTIVRLLNMGLEAFNLVSALNCIVAQRLLKTICKNCKIKDSETTAENLNALGIRMEIAQKMTVYRGQGCEVCSHIGTKGRLGVHEVMTIDEDIKKAILANESSLVIKKIAMRNGMRSLRQNALQRLAEGKVSAKEVVRSTVPDETGPRMKKRAAA